MGYHTDGDTGDDAASEEIADALGTTTKRTTQREQLETRSATVTSAPVDNLRMQR